MVLRNINTGAFEVYDIANNQITGAAQLGTVGLEWQLGGFAADPPSRSTGAMGDSSQVSQLVQAMAGFGGGSGAADGLNIAALGVVDFAISSGHGRNKSIDVGHDVFSLSLEVRLYAGR